VVAEKVYRRANRGYGKCNAFWSFALPQVFERIFKQITSGDRPDRIHCIFHNLNKVYWNVAVLSLLIGRRKEQRKERKERW